jgi:hypothetical protein
MREDINRLITVGEAFIAMKVFLEKYYRDTSADEVGELLGRLKFYKDGPTVDPTMWEDWHMSVNAVSRRKG